MDMLEVMEARHSVRRYNDQPIEGMVLSELLDTIAQVNKESGLHIQLILNEPAVFSTGLATYGKLAGVKNYISLVGEKSSKLEELVGYFGQKIVLKATELGLATCWVGLTYGRRKSTAIVEPNEKEVCVISIGYADQQTFPHKSKSIEELSVVRGPMPDWFRRGMEAVQLAPSAMNRQKVKFTLHEKTVTATVSRGSFADVDLGIAKLHFELGAGEDNFTWGKP